MTPLTTPDLFESERAMPVRFDYRIGLLSCEAEKELLAEFENLPFKPFEFHGYQGKRNAISYGWEYDFGASKVRKAEPPPSFLSPVRNTAAGFVGVAPSDLQHALLLKYPAGASIGWHKDKTHFGDVVGISLLSSCLLRFRRKVGDRWERASIMAQPRSAYLLRDAARTNWEHSIPAVANQRYSITFRTLAGR